MNLQTAAGVVLNEAQLPEPVHEKTDPRRESGTGTVFIALWSASTGCRYRKSRLHTITLCWRTDQGTGAAAMQRRSGSQSGECREKSGLARDEIALVHKTNGSYRRRGPTDTKRGGVGIGDEVLRPEESLRCRMVK